LVWVLVRCSGIVDLPPDVEPHRTYVGGHGEAAEVVRYSWFSGTGDMGGGIEGGCGGDRLQAGDYPGLSVKGENLTRVADLGAG